MKISKSSQRFPTRERLTVWSTRVILSAAGGASLGGVLTRRYICPAVLGSYLRVHGAYGHGLHNNRLKVLGGLDRRGLAFVGLTKVGESMLKDTQLCCINYVSYLNMKYLSYTSISSSLFALSSSMASISLIVVLSRPFSNARRNRIRLAASCSNVTLSVDRRIARHSYFCPTRWIRLIACSWAEMVCIGSTKKRQEARSSVRPVPSLKVVPMRISAHSSNGIRGIILPEISRRGLPL
jgi:hypothetical protein